MSRSSHSRRPLESSTHGGHRRSPHGPGGRRGPAPIPVTASGVPAAVPGAEPPSPVVFTTAESRAQFPWLPTRVIAGSVWRGPDQQRVRVDEGGVARPWR